MKSHFLAAAAALSLLAITPAALAQDQHRRGDQGGAGNQGNPPGQRGHASQSSNVSRSGNTGQHGNAGQRDRASQSGDPGQRSNIGSTATYRRNSVRNYPNATRDARAENAATTGAPRHSLSRGGVATPATGRMSRTGVRSSNVSVLRRNVESSGRFHAVTYRQPQGYVARRWSYGGYLPRSYFARDYWISDYWIYSLFAPPADLVWVRVGDDALLIDEYSGEIIRVEYNVFY